MMIDTFIKNIKNKSEPLIICDIGSRDCEQSIEFYKAFPNAQIFAFECNPSTLPICKKNIESFNDRITLVEGAVCDYDGTITFYPINPTKTRTTWPDGNPGASSIFKSNGKYTIETYVQDTMTVPCHRIDTVMKARGILHTDVLWIDLQGAELLALKGLGNLIKTVKWIHVEVTFKPMYTGQVMFNELHNFLLENGFILINKLNETGWQDDAIYMKL